MENATCSSIEEGSDPFRFFYRTMKDYRVIEQRELPAAIAGLDSAGGGGGGYKG